MKALMVSVALLLTTACTHDAAPEAAPEAASLYVLSAPWKDQNGRALTLSALRGKARIVAMAYTNCEQACPMLVEGLKRLQSDLPASVANKVGFVLISMDPEQDTPEALKAYAAKHHIETWTLLTGTPQDTREIAVALDVRYAKQQDNTIAHSSGITVLDTNGTMVHQEDGVAFSATAVAQALQ